MKRFFHLFVILYGLAVAGAGTAAQAQDALLYEHSIAVPDDSEQSLIDGRRQAMEVVLVKLSGDAAVVKNPGIAAAVADAERYASRYGFQQEADASGARQLYLWAAFDADAIASLLAEQGLRQWQGRRPQTLVWVITQDGGARTIEGADGSSPIADALRTAAGQRGLALVMPLQDLEDQRALSASDLWGNFADTIRAASARYPAGVILVGRLERQGADAWYGRWTVYQGDERHDWEGSASGTAELAAAAMAVHADRLAAVYASRTAPEAPPATVPAQPTEAGVTSAQAAPGVQLQVSGLRGLGGYLRASGYLAGLGTVRSVTPVSASGDRVEFRLRLNGAAQGLQRVLALEGVLVPVAAGAPAVAGGLPEYELLR